MADQRTSAPANERLTARSWPIVRAAPIAIRHRKFHGHPAFQDRFECFFENREDSNSGGNQPDYADVRKRFPDAEPHQGRRGCNKNNARDLKPFQAVFSGKAIGFVGHESFFSLKIME